MLGGQFQLGSIVICLLLETFLCSFLRNSFKCIIQFSSYDSIHFSPQGKNRICVCVSVCVCSVVSDSLWPHGLWPARNLCPWNCPGKNTGGQTQRIKVQQEMHVYLKADSHTSNSRHSKCTRGKGTIWTGKVRLAVSLGWTRKSWAGRGDQEMGEDGTVCGEGFWNYLPKICLVSIWKVRRDGEVHVEYTQVLRYRSTKLSCLTWLHVSPIRRVSLCLKPWRTTLKLQEVCPKE